MTVWHFVTSEYPPDVGGVSDYTGQLAHALARAGDAVHVWCPGGPRPELEGVHVHPELGSIGRQDLRRVGRMLDGFPGPRRLFVQWVPHGFGYHSMNLGFCLWLLRRARAGDLVELMVHEPYIEFQWSSPKYAAMACIHRLMTLVILAASHRVWLAIPAWEGRLRPYALGRRIPMAWLPIPGCIGAGIADEAASVRRRYARDGQALVGHFGSHGGAVAALIDERLPRLMDSPARPAVLLLGADGAVYRDALLTAHPDWSDRVHAAGYVEANALASHFAACDLFVQPYPDGITSRRTSAMACLSQGRPVVTTKGHLTEPLWEQSDAVAIARVDDPEGFVRAVQHLLAHSSERMQLGARGLQLYADRFSVEHVVTTLRAA